MKKILITGANSGIGFETTTQLAAKGYHITMLCRDEKKAKEAKREVIESTDNNNIEILIGDLAKQDDIHNTVDQFRQNNDSLDILINNAGIIPGEREVTTDGVEKTLAVNHLAPFLLTNLLQELLNKAEKSRVINVASEAHRSGVFDPDNIQLTEGYNSLKAYANSKLYNIMFTYALSDRFKATDITTFSLHPGTVRSNLDSGGGGGSLFTFLFKLGKPFMLSPKKGAKTSVYLATEPGIESFTGKYFVKRKTKQPLEVAHDMKKCNILWELSETLTMKWD